MENFPSNSHGDKAEPKKGKNIKPVVSSAAERRKKPLGRRFTETFVGADAKGVWGYVFLDVLVPAAKDMVADAVSTGVERTLFGEVRSSARRGGGRPGYTSYNKFSSGPAHPEPRRQQMSRRARAHHDFDEIVLESRVEAQEVIDNMFSIISEYEVVSVADLYSLCDITPSFTDEKYGWFDMRGAGVTRVRNGYLLDLPKPELLD